ncbi:MAG: LysR family transcriptional regulator [Polyangiaceae bacterium]|nr:LysR family transcriptional regulator [Polyangiaceae bacterium]
MRRSVLDMPASCPESIRRLERELGVVLLLRTTRSVNLTEAGARLVAEAGPAVAAATAALASTVDRSGEPTGVLRLNVPRLAWRVALRPVLREYVRRHPGVRVEVHVDDRNVDIVACGYDAGIRLRESVEKDMATVRISGPIRFVVVGSPTYLAEHGQPERPGDLVHHACIRWQSPTTGEVYRWELEERGRDVEVAVDGPVTSTDAEVIAACAGDGLGLAYVAAHEVARELAAGQLVTVLEAHCPEVPGLFLYFPREAGRVPKLAALVSCIREVGAPEGPTRRSARRR